MPKVIKIGKKKASAEQLEQEVVRLMAMGLNDRQIAQRINPKEPPSRMTIYRIRQRLENKGQLDKAQQAQQEQREYHNLNLQQFEQLPELQDYILGLKGIGKKSWRKKISNLNRICNDLGIYPAQLDIKYYLQWRAKIFDEYKQRGLRVIDANAALRAYNITMRDFLRAMGRANDFELKQNGIDAKHYLDGQYATVLLSEDQIARAIQHLKTKQKDNELEGNEQEALTYKRALAIFRIGTECCTPKQELDDIRPNSFFVPDGDGEYRLRTLREKTGSFWTKYPDQETVKLFKELETADSDGTYFSGEMLGNGISKALEETYDLIGTMDKFFHIRPLHALRHVGAQRLLRKTNWNRAITAELGGWESELTLAQHYGAVPAAIVHNTGKALWN
jgi:transposase